MTLARWYATEAERVYGVLGEDEEQTSQRALVEWIECKGGAVTANDLRRGPREYRAGDIADRCSWRSWSNRGSAIGSWWRPMPNGRPAYPCFSLVTANSGDETPPLPRETGVSSPQQAFDLDEVNGQLAEAAEKMELATW